MSSGLPLNCHVLIIGAGICGLAIAQGLKNAGISFTIFEAEEEFAQRRREWTMALHWSIPMLRELLPAELSERLQEDASVDRSLDYTVHPNNAISIYDGVNGKLLRDIGSDGNFLRVSRRKLRALCRNGIDVKYCHTLQDLSFDSDGDVIASFRNGVVSRGTLLVGADGPRSVVRENLFGFTQSLPTPLGVVYINVAFSYSNADQALFARSANPVTSFAVHPDIIAFVSIQDVPEKDRPETWTFQVVMSWKGHFDHNLPNSEKHRIIKEKAEVLAEPFRSAIQWIPEHVELHANDLSSWIPQIWDTHEGRVTLAGDAAHSMPPNRGQGLNHALNDAYNFVTTVKKILNSPEDQNSQICQYSVEVADRGGEEVKLSRETAYLTLDYHGFTNSPLMKHGLARSPQDQA